VGPARRPHLGRALRARLAGQDMPASAGELASVLHAAFRDLAGTDLSSGPASSVYREQYAHGGLSSRMISLDTWRQRLLPMLFERARARPPGPAPEGRPGSYDPLTPASRSSLRSAARRRAGTAARRGNLVAQTAGLRRAEWMFCVRSLPQPSSPANALDLPASAHIHRERA
jgi:hypothetical protein